MLTLYFTHHPDENIRLKPFLARISSALNTLGINALALPESVNETTEVCLAEVDYEEAKKRGQKEIISVFIVSASEENRKNELTGYVRDVQISPDKNDFIRNTVEILDEIMRPLRWYLSP